MKQTKGCLICDLDQSLISIEDFYLEATVKTAHALGHKYITIKDTTFDYHPFISRLGVSFNTFWETFREFDPRETLEGTIELAKQKKIKKYPGTDHFIETTKRLGFKTGILSDNPHAMYELISLGLEDKFDAYQYWKESMSPGLVKPGPILALKLLQELGYKGGDIWMLGDNAIDVKLRNYLSQILKVNIKFIQHKNHAGAEKSADFIVTNLWEASGCITGFYSK
ncbi:MAG: HAD family hydrolase [Nanoarchaeota archaeon]|nr:HAD family hydrolase [Nanoarchaeota archaeon]